MQWFQATYIDTENRERYVSTEIGAGQRPNEVIDDHETQVNETLATFPASELAPPTLVPPSEATDPKVDAYLGTDGLRHGVITTQGSGETEQQWCDCHAAALATLKAKYPEAA